QSKMWQPKYLILVAVSLSVLACAVVGDGGGRPLVTAVTKDAATSLYTIPVKSGRPLVLDLSGPIVWSTCADGAPHDTLECNNIDCMRAHRFHPPGCPHTGYGMPDVHNPFRCKCTAHPHNPVSGDTASGNMTRVALSANATDGMNPLGPVSFTAVTSCAPNTLLQGLPAGAVGVVGLARSSLAFPAQVAGTQGVANSFALCHLRRWPALRPGAAHLGDAGRQHPPPQARGLPRLLHQGQQGHHRGRTADTAGRSRTAHHRPLHDDPLHGATQRRVPPVHQRVRPGDGALGCCRFEGPLPGRVAVRAVLQQFEAVADAVRLLRAEDHPDAGRRHELAGVRHELHCAAEPRHGVLSFRRDEGGEQGWVWRRCGAGGGHRRVPDGEHAAGVRRGEADARIHHRAAPHHGALLRPLQFYDAPLADCCLV
uniref:Xylanase inhibitor N-terminal domain-containing protein n=1 Tax=Aegilops tauschii subsp. strangulata TaxID=200361 RepID=A0A453GK32_AEGTS